MERKLPPQPTKYGNPLFFQSLWCEHRYLRSEPSHFLLIFVRRFTCSRNISEVKPEQTLQVSDRQASCLLKPGFEDKRSWDCGMVITSGVVTSCSFLPPHLHHMTCSQIALLYFFEPVIGGGVTLLCLDGDGGSHGVLIKPWLSSLLCPLTFHSRQLKC